MRRGVNARVMVFLSLAADRGGSSGGQVPFVACREQLFSNSRAARSEPAERPARRTNLCFVGIFACRPTAACGHVPGTCPHARAACTPEKGLQTHVERSSRRRPGRNWKTRRIYL